MADLFKDSILLQAKIYAYCYQGALETSEGLLEALEEKWKKAFFHIGKARNAYLKANLELHEREHGKWKGFYANECLTDIKHTAWILEGMMAYLRNMGEWIPISVTGKENFFIQQKIIELHYLPIKKII